MQRRRASAMAAHRDQRPARDTGQRTPSRARACHCCGGSACPDGCEGPARPPPFFWSDCRCISANASRAVELRVPSQLSRPSPDTSHSSADIRGRSTQMPSASMPSVNAALSSEMRRSPHALSAASVSHKRPPSADRESSSMMTGTAGSTCSRWKSAGLRLSLDTRRIGVSESAKLWSSSTAKCLAKWQPVMPASAAIALARRPQPLQR